MKNSIIIENYSKLSKVYLNRFTLFVESPYFNKHNPTKKLHEYLMDLHPNFEEIHCTKEVVFKKVFEQEKFKLQKLKDVNSILLDLFEQFLASEALKKDNELFRRLEIQECFDNKLNRQTKKVLNVSFKESEKSKINQSKLYYHKYLLNDFAYSFQVTNGDRKTSAFFLQESINNLDRFYFSEKMLLGSAIINRTSIVKNEFEFLFFEEINDLIKKNTLFFEGDIIIKINQQLFLLQKALKEEYYYNLKKLISDCNLNRSELKIYYSFLSNFCIRMINSGKQNYLNEQFNLNKEIISKDLLLENNIISEWSYKNIIAISLRLKEFDWIETFIEKYTRKLKYENYLNAYNYNMANLAYFKKNYDIAQGLLLNVEYTDIFYLLNSKSLLLKIYFDTNEHEPLDYLLHSFRLLVMRQKKISTKLKNGYLNLIKITKSILKIEMKKTTLKQEDIFIKTNDIIEQTKKYDSIADKAWLLEKAENLINVRF